MLIATPAPWPQRTVGLAVLGAAVALAVRALTVAGGPDDLARPALATFLIVAATVLALVVSRRRSVSGVAFAVGAGVVVAGVIAASGSSLGVGGDSWRLAAALFAAAIAAPLVQARWLDERPFGYAVVREYTYANLIRFAAAWVFTAIAFGLAWLLAGLFTLIGIDLLSRVLRNWWLALPLIGAINGAALGIMRDRDGGIGGLGDSAADALTPVFAFGLSVFLIAIPFTGLAPLWAATKATTPILLGAIAVAVRMIDSVAGGHPGSESRNRVVRIAGQVLAAAILPLAVIAIVSVRARVGQHGLTPDRLWALTLSGVGCAIGAVYWWALAQRRDVLSAIRRAHLWLMIALTALAVLLSTPLAGFGAISARDQEARLVSGRVAPDKFDWQALAHDFGPAGRTAVARLKRSPNAAIAQAAAGATTVTTRGNGPPIVRSVTLRAIPAGTAIPPDLQRLTRDTLSCAPNDECTVLYKAGDDRAVGVALGCDDCPVQTQSYVREATGWTVLRSATNPAAMSGAVRAKMRYGHVDIRPVTRRQIVVDGQPVGEVLPEASAPPVAAAPP